MTEEYVYDKRRITMVVVSASLIICAGVVLVLMWPAPTPPIGDVMTDVIVTTDSEVISSKYAELFVGNSINGENMTMLKISVYAYNIYYVNRMVVTLEVADDTFMIAIAVAEMANEANILIGKNNFEGGQTIYTNSLMINQANYVIYIILGTPAVANFHYNVRVGE